MATTLGVCTPHRTMGMMHATSGRTGFDASNVTDFDPSRETYDEYIARHAAANALRGVHTRRSSHHAEYTPREVPLAPAPAPAVPGDGESRQDIAPSTPVPHPPAEEDGNAAQAEPSAPPS
jgi:hypothetical protein